MEYVGERRYSGDPSVLERTQELWDRLLISQLSTGWHTLSDPNLIKAK